MENSTGLTTTSTKPELQLSPSPEIIHKAHTEITKLLNSGKLDFQLAFKGKALGWYRRNAGLVETIQIVQNYLLSICHAYKLDNTLNEMEAAQIAKKIIQEHPSLKLAELPLFAEMAKQGKLIKNENGITKGQVFGAINEKVVFEWLEIFYEWQAERIEELKASKKMGFAGDFKNADKILTILKEIQKEQAFKTDRERQVKDELNREEKNKRLTLYYLMRWFPKEFDAIQEVLLYRYHRWPEKKQFTTAEILEMRKVKLLLAQKEKAMERNLERV